MAMRAGSLVTVTHASSTGSDDAVLIRVSTRPRLAWPVALVAFGVLWSLALPWTGGPMRNPLVLGLGAAFLLAAVVALSLAAVRARRQASGTLRADGASRSIRRVRGFRSLPWDEVSIPRGAALVIESFEQRTRTPSGESAVRRFRLVLDPHPPGDTDEWCAWGAHLASRVWVHPPRVPPGTRLLLPPLPLAVLRLSAQGIARSLDLSLVELP